MVLYWAIAGARRPTRPSTAFKKYCDAAKVGHRRCGLPPYTPIPSTADDTVFDKNMFIWHIWYALATAGSSDLHKWIVRGVSNPNGLQHTLPLGCKAFFYSPHGLRVEFLIHGLQKQFASKCCKSLGKTERDKI